ncbi:MAG: zinc ribbon domain-containing protein [Desulfacinum sp.]|jgi:putative FmdB family regulatory protein|nr:zinc ribbon domain-containing protein [Desulfacinum sp.]MBZ4660115.1 zinc ribbon protein [Desulfacinum sp.]
MPIYEFRCVRCDHIQEVLVSSSSAPVEMKCEKCQGEELERVLSRVSYMMGGSSSSGSEGAKVTTKSCSPGSSCATIELPGHTR